MSDAKRVKRGILSFASASLALSSRLFDKLSDFKAIGTLFSEYGHVESRGFMLGSDTVAWGYMSNALSMPVSEIEGEGKLAPAKKRVGVLCARSCKTSSLTMPR